MSPLRLLLLALTIAGAACETERYLKLTPDRLEVERGVRDTLLGGRIPGVKVACPATVKLALDAPRAFDCTATVGEFSFPVHVSASNNAALPWDLELTEGVVGLDAARQQIKAKTQADAVDCGKGVALPAIKGLDFTCQVTRGSEEAQVVVTVVDRSGEVNLAIKDEDPQADPGGGRVVAP